MRFRPSPRTRKVAVGAVALSAVGAMNAPAVIGFASHKYHDYKINQPSYKARYGHWDLADVPERFRINSIHAALLHTGKVLMIAGSGNDEQNFDAGTFQSVLWDPVKNTFKEIHTPKDMFCAGHAQLPDGKLLVAGGTRRYEKLKGDVTRAGGLMVVKNEDPDKPRTLPKGTVFRSPKGIEYRSQFPAVVPRAKKTPARDGSGKMRVTAREARVFVEAVRRGKAGVTNTAAQYDIKGLKGADARNHYGLATKLGLDKKDFQGLKDAYEFDPVAERYLRVDPMSEARWYPTLVTLKSGKVLAVSGLDDMGEIIPGKNEIYDPKTRKWSKGPNRYFPTYPALFLTGNGKLFYSGSNAGYGPAEKGRVPGIWNVRKNTFKPVPGLTEADRTETSASVLLPPAQKQQVMLFGGGGVGESPRSTGRTALVDLTEKNPRYHAGPDLSEGTRYLNAVLTPDDKVFTSGGSRDYRGKGASDNHKAQIFDPRTRAFTRVADPTVGRNYHSEALLLPDGRIAVFGSDPLFSDRADSRGGEFEKRIEVYTPPYLYERTRPAAAHGPVEVERGGTTRFTVAGAGKVKTARLMRPSAVTHVTDVEQRSIALDFTRRGGTLSVKVPGSHSLVPRGWYMLFLMDSRGTPSQAKWVHVK
ncbi:kelch motif-containing protein [Streptomyces sp. NPDC047117]|uniref:kelch motif-containing protein n=1 Tax=unclassified Streptomyces TaxID=2593676 RepID=UPI0033F4D651